MFYFSKYIGEEYNSHLSIFNEHKDEIENNKEEWDEFLKDLNYYREKVKINDRRLKNARYVLKYQSARKFGYPIDVEIPIILDTKEVEYYIDLTLLQQDMGYYDDADRIDRRKGFLYYVKEKVGYYKFEYVYQYDEDGFYVNKHIIAALYGCQLIGMELFNHRIRNKKLEELLKIWMHEHINFLEKTSAGAEALKILFKDKEIPTYQKIDNEMVQSGTIQDWIKEAEKRPSPEEYFKKKAKDQERIKKASDKERDELFN
ncbi:MAG: hypothetical protein M0Q13_13620 [Methanothrix sp.]|jgi:hypothetical protein|nr:hypothetical protein [Methanothrix sp.]